MPGCGSPPAEKREKEVEKDFIFLATFHIIFVKIKVCLKGGQKMKENNKRKWVAKIKTFARRIARKARRESLFSETNRSILLHFSFGLFAVYCLYGKEIRQMLSEIGFSNLLERCVEFTFRLPFEIYEVTTDFSLGQIAILFIAVYCYKKGYELQREKIGRIGRRNDRNR